MLKRKTIILKIFDIAANFFLISLARKSTLNFKMHFILFRYDECCNIKIFLIIVLSLSCYFSQNCDVITKFD